MQRDMDLIRQIILKIEDSESGGFVPLNGIQGYTEEQIGYHCYLIVDAGLAQGSSVGGMGSPSPKYIISNLTSAGHDFAEASRTEFIWDEVKQDVQSKGIKAASIKIVKQLLDTAIRKRLGAE